MGAGMFDDIPAPMRFALAIFVAHAGRQYRGRRHASASTAAKGMIAVDSTAD